MQTNESPSQHTPWIAAGTTVCLVAIVVSLLLSWRGWTHWNQMERLECSMSWTVQQHRSRWYLVTLLVVILDSSFLMEIWNLGVFQSSDVLCLWWWSFMLKNCVFRLGEDINVTMVWLLAAVHQFFGDGVSHLIFKWDAYTNTMFLFSFTQKNSKICFILNCLLVIICSTLCCYFFGNKVHV